MHAPRPSAESPLGRPAPYPTEYAPEVLFGIAREEARRTLGLDGRLPFGGVDVWNAYELSWLDPKGKPVVATAELWVPCASPRIVESKSLKLYLGSLGRAHYASADAVRERIATDVGRIVGAEIEVSLTPGADSASDRIGSPEGLCIDALDVEVDTYEVAPALLAGSTDAGTIVAERLYSHLLRSRCPITGQPDWATVILRYRGARIAHAALLRYIASYRDHGEFHEQCVERMFVDIWRQCRPEALSVHARYTRRGGVDINPFRTSSDERPSNLRIWRQ